MKTWQFVLAMVGSAVVGVIILFFIAGMIAGYTQAGANGNASGSSSTSTDAGDSQSKPQSNDSQSNESQSGDSEQTKQDEEKADPVITSITVKYTGTTAIGTEINDSTPGIAVTAKYDNGSTRPVGSGYTVKNPGKLEAGQTQTFTVSYKGLTADFTVKVDESDDQFKASTQDVPFDDLARNPDANKGKRVHFRGQIKQVIEASSNIVAYRISVEQDAYGYWTSDKVIYVTYIREGNDNRLLENDIVELWGTSGGTITYKSAMGGDITIPSVVARIMQLSQ